MTYQEKYEELYKEYDTAAKVLNDARQKIAFANGSGDRDELANYFKANAKLRFTEKEFHKLLNYVTTANLDPTTEYVSQEYMYNFIKKDHQKRGILWNDED